MDTNEPGADLGANGDADADTVIGVPATHSRRHGVSAEEMIHGDTIIVRSELAPGADEPASDTDELVPGFTDMAPHCFTMSIGSHPPIPLDVPVFIGRHPRTPRITGTILPRLVMVPSPSQQVSATHVEVRQEGDSVVVTDLGSTNGTIVANPGNAPVGLRQGESVVIVEGSIVDIGDGIRFTIARERTDSTGGGGT